MKLKLKSYKNLKPNFIIFLFLTLLSNSLIYLFQFYFYAESVDYFLCTEIISYKVNFFSSSIDLIYPESCDLKVYAEGVINIFSFYNLAEFVYLDRPLFVLFISIIYKILNLLIFSSISSLAILKTSFFIGQLILTSLVCCYLFKIFNLVKINIGKSFLFFPWLVSISPMFKWHIFESTSMTFTFLIFLFGIYIILNNKNLDLKFYFFQVGLLFLFHRSAFLILIFFIVFKFIKKEINYRDLLKILNFFIPLFFYYSSIYLFSSFSDHQAEEYRQFVWILDYLQGKETKIGGYFCQSPKLALICYFKDLILLLKYLFLPSLINLILLINNYKKLTKPVKELIFLVILFSLIINSFWLFIGWYPPVRFSYYGYGNFLIFLSILIFINFHNNFSKIFYFLGYSSYFLLLNHWNSPVIVKINTLFIFSLIFFLLSVLNESFKKT